MRVLNQGIDHVEFVVRDLKKRAAVYERMGFEKVGERHLPKQGTRSELWQQGWVRILLTTPDGSGVSEQGLRGEGDLALGFLGAQDEGVTTLALEVESVEDWFSTVTRRGAQVAKTPFIAEDALGSVKRAEVYTPGRLRYAFIERKSPNGSQNPCLFDEALTTRRLESPSPCQIRVVDHLTNNVAMGEMSKWVKWYKEVFGFIVTRHFDIRTTRTGLISDVVESPDGKIKVPINEGTEKSSQVQEFVDRLKGPGVQHLAFLTTDLIDTLNRLRLQQFKFLTVPHTYYEVVPTRVPGVTENLSQLEELGILLDGEQSGYLLQIFSEEILGPFFFEYIQRKGNRGFGEGNFKALFEAIERDQLKRGVLR